MAVTLANHIADVQEYRDMLDELGSRYSTFNSAKNAIVSRLDTTGMENLIAQTETMAKSYLDAMDAACSNFAQALVDRMLHRLTLEDFPRVDIPPGISRHDLTTKMLVSLWAYFVASAGATVKTNVVSAGAITATKNNANAGTANLTIKLPGHIAPTVGGHANPYYFDLNSELSKADSAVIECVVDSNSKRGVSRGYEQFRCSGLPAAPAPFSQRWSTVDGDGTVAYMQPVQGRSVVNLSFDSFTSNTPNGWTITSGSPGIEVLEETTNVVSGSALELTGTAALNIPVPVSVVAGRSQMCLVFLIRKDGTTSGTYTISVTGTGLTTVTTGALNGSALTTSFEPTVLRIPMPATVPTDLKINIATSAISGGPIYIDQGGFAEYEYWNGIGVAIYEGRETFTVGDTFAFAVTNNYAGDNQTTFAKVFRAQMPSIDPGSTYG